MELKSLINIHISYCKVFMEKQFLCENLLIGGQEVGGPNDQKASLSESGESCLQISL